MVFVQSLRMLQRDWRAGELRFLLVALIIAVASLSAVGFFVDRMRAGLNQEAHQLLGADIVVSSDQPIDLRWRSEAVGRHLTLAETVVFPSMAMRADGSRSQLASLKAVSAGYPLRGNLIIADSPAGPEVTTREIPAAGTVWVDANILSTLNLQVGDMLQLGDAVLRIARVLRVEPDRGSNFINFAPRVMFSLADLAATNLVQDGSRVTYRLLVAGQPQQAAQFQQWVGEQIARDHRKGVRLEDLENGRPEMRATLDRAEQFLSLVSLLSALLAAVAVAMAARRYMLRHLDACAMLRCLGMHQHQVTKLYLYEFLFIGLIGSGIGVLVGFGAHFILLDLFGNLIAHDLPAGSFVPVGQGMLLGMLLLTGFALPPLLQLRNVSHNRVLRREQDAAQGWTLVSYVAGLAVLVGLLLWQTKDVTLGSAVILGFLGGCGVFAALAWLALYCLRHMRLWLPYPSWRFAVTALQRRRLGTVVQVVAVALGLMALLLLTVIRGDLIGAWRAASPIDAPNRFVINIQEDQRFEIAQRIQAIGIAHPALFPMIRGRLVEVNDRLITAATYTDERAKRLVDREFNLSSMDLLPAQNQIVAGKWFDNQPAQASVEEGLAKTLHLKLGDKLQFDIAGQLVSAYITSLRKLDWGSMQVNFFVILHPQLMQNMPKTWITAFNLPALHADFANQLTRDFPNLTIVDIASIVQQVQQVMEQVIRAIEFLFLFTLVSGGLVLYAALIGTQEERKREAGLLRALGATRRQLSSAQWIEFVLIGCLAGCLAASGAAIIGWALAHFVFNFNWTFSPLVWLAGMAAGALCTCAGGAIGLRHVLQQPPLQTLREVST